MKEISRLDRLNAMLSSVIERQQIMNEGYWLFEPKEHIQINKLKKDIQKQIRGVKNGKVC